MTDIVVTEKPQDSSTDEDADGMLPPEELVAFAKNLLEYRTKNRYSQRAIAEMAGLNQPMVSDIERCEGNPTIRSLSAIAKAIGVPLHKMIRP